MSRATGAATLMAGGLFAVGLAAPVLAQSASKEASAKSEAATIAKAPDTAQAHLAMAEAYRAKAATFRREAAEHRQMLRAYTQEVAVPTDHKLAVENPWIKKMRVHCATYVTTAESLATEAEAFAMLHTLRAHETAAK